MLRQVEVPAHGNPFQLLHAERITEHNVRAGFCVMRQVFFFVHIKRKPLLSQTDGKVPLIALFDPFLVQVRPKYLVGGQKVLDFHLFEFPRAKREIAWGNFVAESLPDLRNPERQFNARRINDIYKKNKNPLGGFGAQIRNARFGCNGTDLRLKHQIKFPRRR